MSKPMLPSLGKAEYRELLSYRQTPDEAACVQQIANKLRVLRAAYQLTRDDLSKKLGIERELLVIVENGDGNPETALKLLETTQVALHLP
jgi:DNA-binding XRE family transcriptional regulator